MNDKDELVVVLDSEMEVVVESQKNAMLSVYEDMDALILKATEIDVPLNDEEKYNEAIELKRTIKATHIAINKKEKELKSPLLLMKSRLSEFVKTIYNPLKDAEKVVKRKTDAYEDEQKRLKAEKKALLENQGKEREILDAKLHKLNATLVKINEAKTVGDVEEIEKMLGEVDLKSFGDRSDEAGFLVGNLTMTCGMAKKGLPVGEPEKVEEKKAKIIIESVNEAIDKNPKLVERVKEGEKIVEEKTEFTPNTNGQSEARENRDESTSKTIEAVKEAVKKKTEFTERIKDGEKVDEVAEELGMKIVSPIKKEGYKGMGASLRTSGKISGDETSSTKKNTESQQTVDGELDFGAVAETQANAPKSKEEQQEEEIQKVFFSPEKVDELLGNSVLPRAVYEGLDENDVSEVITICSTNKPHPNGLPDGLKVMIEYSNGSIIYGAYKLTDIKKEEEE